MNYSLTSNSSGEPLFHMVAMQPISTSTHYITLALQNSKKKKKSRKEEKVGKKLQKKKSTSLHIKHFTTHQALHSPLLPIFSSSSHFLLSPPNSLSLSLSHHFGTTKFKKEEKSRKEEKVEKKLRKKKKKALHCTSSTSLHIEHCTPLASHFLLLFPLSLVTSELSLSLSHHFGTTKFKKEEKISLSLSLSLSQTNSTFQGAVEDIFVAMQHRSIYHLYTSALHYIITTHPI